MLQKIPQKLYNTQQIRALEQLAIASGTVGFALMTRAGRAAFEVLSSRCPDASTFAVFCGGGNNAGDGYIVALLLHTSGRQVRVYSLVDPLLLIGDAFLAYQAFSKARGLVLEYGTQESMEADVFVDGLLGIGLSREVSGLYAKVINSLNASGKPIFALDIPSGLNADTGMVMGVAVKAVCTITFIGLKRGLFTGDAPEYCGELIGADLALPEALYEQVPAQLHTVAHQPLERRPRTAHKGMNGQVLVVGGAPGYSGAAFLASVAALRVGSGLVSLATHVGHASFLNLQCPELMCYGVDSPEQLTALLAKASIVVVGPGLGQSVWGKALLAAVLATTKPLVVDADALNLLAQQTPPVDPRPNWILTPHPGEAGRLLKTNAQTVQQDRFAAAQALQAQYGGVVVLKGAGTLIIDSESVALSTSGNPGMAGGGMGDVLTGVIAGLYAQGLGLTAAAQQGVYIHGAAADNAAEVSGERGLLASDLFPFLQQWVN